MNASVSVAIICHNYGHYLREAVESVLAQTLRPVEVLVIDDASTDDTAAVAAEFGNQVRYIRVDTGRVWINRLRAIDQMRGDWVLCLDADNVVPPEYLQRAVEIGSADPACGVIYPSLARFGRDDQFVDFTSPRYPVSVANYIDAAAVYRRDAILQADLHGIELDLVTTSEDWVLARRVLAAGWSTHHNPAPLRYRVHENNKSGRIERKTYYDDAGLACEPVTICIPLSGRTQLWSMTADWLSRQNWPVDQCRLVLIDNSHCDSFSRTIRRWIAECDYSDVRYYRSNIGRAGQADEQRTGRPEHDRTVHRTVASLYNRAFIEATTDYVLTLEDDIAPPADAIEQLLRSMDQRVAAVSGAYRHRNGKHWLTWRADEWPAFQTERGSGVEVIGGAGFGCLLIRKLVANSLRLRTDGPTPFYDRNAFLDLSAMGWRVAVNWDVECKHLAEAL